MSCLAAPFPTALQIEPTNICNLRCPTCPTGAGKLKRKPGYMSLQEFKNLVDEAGDYIINMTLHNYGESFLHKDFLDMVSYAAKRGITCRVSTNGHFFKDKEFCKRIVLCGLGDIKISLDGASQETYEKFRLGGDFGSVIKGTKLLVDTRHELGKILPRIEIQFILMKPNQHEIEKAKEISREIGVDRVHIKSVNVSMRDMDFENLVNEYLPEGETLSRFVKTEDGLRLRQKMKAPCWWIYEQMVINWDGSVTACCYDYYDELVMGNVFRDGGIYRVWNNSRFQELRRMQRIDINKIPLCSVCPEASITSTTDIFAHSEFL
jgi:radical SAM protein with 4Fe4S-binding SPASM domain